MMGWRGSVGSNKAGRPKKVGIRITIAIVGLWMGAAVAADLVAPKTVAVLIRPDCKQAFFFPCPGRT
jgi:hypothetical protein